LRYPADHLDVYTGPSRSGLLADQVDLLARKVRGRHQDVLITAEHRRSF